MFKQFNMGNYNLILIIGVVLFLFEIVFSGSGIFFSIAFQALFLYLGWRNFEKLWGKIIFWVFLIGIFFVILNLAAVRFYILVTAIILLINYVKLSKEPREYIPTLPGSERVTEDMIKKDSLFTNAFFEDLYTDETVYQWRDVNMYGFMGERVIDLSNTVLPNDTAVISIRHGLGKIEIYVPYEVEVSVHHSSVFGKVKIFQENDERFFNQSIAYQTAGYDTAIARVKIVTSVFSGDIEVKRI